MTRGGVVKLRGGFTYQLSPTVVRSRLQFVLDGEGEVTFDGSALGSSSGFTVHAGGTLLIPPGVNWILPRNAVGVEQYDGAVLLDGKGRNAWDEKSRRIVVVTPGNTIGNAPDTDGVTRVGQLIVVKQGTETIVRGYTCTARPHRYVAFVGNPLELNFPPRTGVAKRVLVEHLLCVQASHNESLVRWMHGYGVTRLCLLNNLEQKSAATHKAALQPRGTNMIVDRCEIAGSIHAGWLDCSAPDNGSHASPQKKMPRGWLHVSNCAIRGYVECRPGVTVALRNCHITGVDPRGGPGACVHRVKNGNMPRGEVVCSGITGSGFARLVEDGVIVDDREKLMRIFANAAAP
jgi:hypothetical protein